MESHITQWLFFAQVRIKSEILDAIVPGKTRDVVASILENAEMTQWSKFDKNALVFTYGTQRVELTEKGVTFYDGFGTAWWMAEFQNS